MDNPAIIRSAYCSDKIEVENDKRQKIFRIWLGGANAHLTIPYDRIAEKADEFTKFAEDILSLLDKHDDILEEDDPHKTRSK
jgi:hypothetical protein